MWLAQWYSRSVMSYAILVFVVVGAGACRDLVSSPPGVDDEDPVPNDTLLPPPDTSLVASMSPAHYDTEPLQEGDEYYVDRGYTLEQLEPAYRGWLWIRTANDDKEIVADTFLTFELRDQAIVAVGYDKRVTVLPNWLQDWAEAPQGIGVSDGGASPLRVFYKVFDPGSVVLGSNMAGGAVGAQSMYVPMVLETTALRPVAVHVSPDQVTLNPGETRQFSAAVLDQLGQAAGGVIDWTATGGAISAAGSYTAGDVPGTYTVTATEPGSGLAGSASVTVTDTTATLDQVLVTPANVTLDPGASQQFQAYGRTSTGDSIAVAVGWTATGGTIDATGRYTAGDVPGTFQVTASEANAGISGAARIVVRDTSGGAWVLVGAGDISDCGNDGDEATAKLLDNIEGTVFTTGDNVYNSGTLRLFNNCYDPTWGRHKARTRPSPGNHEYLTPDAAGYYAYFGSAAGDPDKGYYSYDVGSWHVVVLNSEIDISAGSPQVGWLQDDLAANPSTCTVAYWHRPRFSSGNHGNDSRIEPIWDVLYAAGVDVVLNGHDHSYERFAPQTPDGVLDTDRGIREFVIGTGGKSLRGFGTPEDNSEVRDSSTYGVLKLTLHESSYDWEFVPVSGGTFTDAGSDSCHQ